MIRLHGILREESNTRELIVEGRCLTEVIEKLPESVRKVIMKYSQYLLILVNGKRVYDLTAVLEDNDIVDMIPPAGGGIL
ncbi:MAG: MoaD/ThiS family protein [Sulfolobales archaeon]